MANWRTDGAYVRTLSAITCTLALIDALRSVGRWHRRTAAHSGTACASTRVCVCVRARTSMTTYHTTSSTTKSSIFTFHVLHPICPGELFVRAYQIIRWTHSDLTKDAVIARPLSAVDTRLAPLAPTTLVGLIKIQRAVPTVCPIFDVNRQLPRQASSPPRSSVHRHPLARSYFPHLCARPLTAEPHLPTGNRAIKQASCISTRARLSTRNWCAATADRLHLRWVAS